MSITRRRGTAAAPGPDGPATERAATGPDGFLADAAGLIWVQMTTIGTDWTARLAEAAARYG